MGEEDAAAVGDDHLGATGGATQKTTTKTVRFVSVSEQVDAKDREMATKVKFDASDGILVPEPIDYPILRVSSADSGIEAFCVDYDSKYSPNISNSSNQNDDDNEPKYEDTAF